VIPMLTNDQVESIKQLLRQLAADAVDESDVYDRGCRNAAESVLRAIEAYEKINAADQPRPASQGETGP
jgi:hypothetical protein